jgi:hypothetical protein
VLPALACLAWLLGPGTATEAADLGNVTLDQPGFGSTVSVSTPSSRLLQESDEFVVHRTFVTSRNAEPGLIQVGVYRSGSGIEIDNCGTHSGYVVFTEVKPVNSLAYRCQLYNQVAPGTVINLDIFRFHAAATWGIRINGTPTGLTYQLGFANGVPAVGTEIQDVDSNDGTHTATRYGPNGHAPWRVYRAVARARPHAVSATDPTSAETDDPFWAIRGPPGRVSIRHRQ